MRGIGRIYIVILGLSMLGCKEVNEATLPVWSIALPAHFDELPVPEENPMNQAKIDLGAHLFYDPMLSIDSSISCAHCHLASLSFSDGEVKSIGIGDSLSQRNAPVLVNLAYASSYMMDGGVPTLELQAVAPIMHEGEMGSDLFVVSDRLTKNENYQLLSKEAFGREIDAAVIAYSLAAFQRSILSYQSKFDRVMEGDASFTESEQRGYDLFYSDSLNCSACHSGVNFSDYSFYNLGLYQNDPDPGRWRITENESDRAKFKTATLRNIHYSAPYMHDGSIESLEEVIHFKMSGGIENPNKSDKFEGFYLDGADQKALISFLETLSDPSFIEREELRAQAL